MLENLSAYRAARLLIDKHGDGAMAYAAAWMRALREAGNPKDARMFEHIILAIDHLEQTRRRRTTRATVPRAQNLRRALDLKIVS